ncbi:MAG: hypothetical protein AB7G13_11180 [Lautropia sp.]
MGIRWGIAVTGGLAALSTVGGAVAQTGPAPGLGSGLRIDEPSLWTFQVSGLVSHFKEPTCENCSYRTAVPGIGLQREFIAAADSPVRFSLAAGLQNDSLGESGGYAAAIASLVWRGESVIVKPGLGGFAFYRYMGENRADRTAEGREIVPAILPVLSVEGARSGFGATLLLAPNFSYAGRDRSGFVFLQFSYRLGRGGSGSAIGRGSGTESAAIAENGSRPPM